MKDLFSFLLIVAVTGLAVIFWFYLAGFLFLLALGIFFDVPEFNFWKAVAMGFTLSLIARIFLN